LSTDVTSILDSKFRQTEIDGLSIDDNFVIFSSFANHIKIREDLKTQNYKNFVGFVVPQKKLNYPTANLPENEYLDFFEAEKLIDGATHLVLTADMFIELLNFVGLQKMESWNKKTHIPKIVDWLEDRSGKDIYRHLVPNWAYEKLHEGFIKESYSSLKLFLKLYGPRKFNIHERMQYLADSDISGLKNGNISSILNAGADLQNAWIFYKDAVSSMIMQECAPLPHPLWNGESFIGKRIVFRRELGPGDEIAYSNIFNELIRDGIEVIVEVDLRLVDLFKRSFTGAEIVPRLTPAHPRLLQNDIDYQANYSDPFLMYRSDFKNFPNHTGYILPNQKLKSHWQKYFDTLLPNKLKIGISWGSKSSGDVEDKMKTDIQQWAPILSISDACFINLQYGDVKADLSWAKSALDIEIHEITDIDMYNDLDALGAVMANMDLVISVNNTNSHMAGAIGTPLWEIVPNFWHLLFGQTYSPFYPKSKIFEPTNDGLLEIASLLSEQIGKARISRDFKKSFRELTERIY
jgi:hypothetical protein